MSPFRSSFLPLLLGCAGAFTESAPPQQQFLIEREIKGAGSMSAAQLHESLQKSSSVLRGLGPVIQ